MTTDLELAQFIRDVEAALDDHDFSEAKAKALICSQKFPLDPIPDYLLAVTCNSTNEYNQALKHVDNCLEKYAKTRLSNCPGFVKATCLRADTLWHLGEREQSEQILTQVAQQHRYGMAYLILARQALRLEDIPLTIQHCAAGIKIAPFNFPLWACQAQGQYALDDLVAARSSLFSALSINADDPSALRLIAKVELKLDNYVSALARAETILSTDSQCQVGLSVSFFCCLSLGYWDKAEAILPMLLTVDSAESETYLSCYESSRKTAKNESLSFDRDSLFNAGLITYRQGDFDKAMSLFKTAQTLGSVEDQQILAWIGHCLTSLDQAEAANHCYQKIDLRQPWTTEEELYILRNWGNNLLLLDQPAAALPLFEQAALLDPYHVETLTALTICYRFSGDLIKAIATGQRGMDLSPTDTNLAIVYVACLLSVEQLELAAIVAGKLMEVAPLDPKSHYVSARLWQAMGKNLVALNFACYFLRQCPEEQMAIDLYRSVRASLDREMGIS